MRYLILLVLLAIGCAAPAPLDGPVPYPETVEENPIATAYAAPIRVCVDVPEPHRAKVLQGIDGWRRVTQAWREWQVVDAGPCDLTVVEVDRGERCELNASACVDTLGGLDRVRPFGTLYMVRGEYEVNPAFSTIHEIGHLLGLDHVDGGVMQAAPTPGMWGGLWTCPDDETISSLEAHLGMSLARCAL